MRIAIALDLSEPYPWHLRIYQGLRKFFDPLDGVCQVVWVRGHVAHIGHLKTVERSSPRPHVVGPDQGGFGSNLAWAEASAPSMGCTQIEGDTYKACV